MKSRLLVVLGLLAVWAGAGVAPAQEAAPSTANAAALEQRAAALSDEGKFAEALPVAAQALQAREASDGPEALVTMKALLALAWLQADAGQPAAALPLFERAVATLERTRGPIDEEVATARNGLAALHHSEGRLSEARAEWLRVLAITEQKPGLESFAAVRVLGNLAALHFDVDDTAQADGYFRRALSTAEKVLGPEHRVTLMVLGNYGNFLVSIGDFARAHELLGASLQRRQKVLGGKHPLVSEAVFNLAACQLLEKNYKDAELGFRDALKRMEEADGPESPRTARVLSALAETLSHSRSDEAARLAARALAIQEKQRGPQHRDVAEALRDAATVELRRPGGARDPEKVEQQLRRALEIYEREFGPASRHTVGALDKLAISAHRAGRRGEAREYARRALRGKEAMLASVLSFAPESQRLAYKALADAASVPAVLGETDLLAEAVLRTEAIVLDSLLEDRRVVSASADPAIRAQVELTRDLRSRLRTAQAERASPTRDERVRSLTAAFEEAEIALTRSVTALGRSRRALATEPAAVRAAVPDDAVLIEYVRYAEPAAAGQGEQASYGALLLPPLAAATGPRWIPLGSAATIEREIRQLQRGVSPTGKPLEAELAAQALHRLVWQPVAQGLPGGTRRLLLSPAGELHSISFAALAAKDGRFVAEDFTITYLSAGRDLLVSAPPPPSGPPGLLVVANPKFQLETGKTLVASATPLTRNLARQQAFRQIDFRQLPGAQHEALQLLKEASRLGWQSDLLTGEGATKGALLAILNGPRVLHLATHGFYVASPRLGATALPDPMLRSGIALAGAVDTMSAWLRGDLPAPIGPGVLTAAEASELDLRHTWLVTLSACESGLGENRVGEGVLGLRRGFALAGAQHLLVTLWPVADQDTSTFMQEFYGKALEGDPSVALAEVQRALLTHTRKHYGTGRAIRTAGAFILSSQVGK
ncbi:MAG: CHAT domain-containing protein [Verrucomicrobia bacterium]|nr:CHAT domain-containing protein [Verrucomicrobiota bacterium]